MDIQVGDRVTFKNKDEDICCQIIENNKQLIGFTYLYDSGEYEIIKIERPKYKVIEEKKELLTEEEKEFLKNYIKLTDLSYDYIFRDYDYLYLHIHKSTDNCKMKIEINDYCFKNLEFDEEYTLSELGLEE